MSSESDTTEDRNAIYCAHCGTRNEADAYTCDRCGERVYIPNPAEPPALGFAECPRCLAANESRASFCAKCGSSMANAARISIMSTGERTRQAPHTTPGGIRISPRSRDIVRTGRRPAGEQPPADSATESERRAAMLRQEQRRRQVEREERERREREWISARAREREREREQEQQESESESEPEKNDSGTSSAQLPGAARGWNTAAFLIGPIWGPANGVWIGVISLIVLVIPVEALDWVYKIMLYFGFGAYMGLKGNELAWRARRWASVTQFRQVQQLWMVASLIVSLVLFVLVGTIVSGS